MTRGTPSDVGVVPWWELDRAERPVVLTDVPGVPARSSVGWVHARDSVPAGRRLAGGGVAEGLLHVVFVPRLAAIVVLLLMLSGCAGAFVLGSAHGVNRRSESVADMPQVTPSEQPSPLTNGSWDGNSPRAKGGGR